MTNEEIKRTMEFIIKQQESFAESMERAEIRMNGLERAFIGVFNIVTETAKGFKELTGRVDVLAEKIETLMNAETNTDERLNIFITPVEHYISDIRSGEIGA